MKKNEIMEIVHQAYWEQNINCAGTVLSALSKIFSIPLHPDVYLSAIGMHGAGGARAQCGLVEGALMFTGIAGSRLGKNKKEIVAICHDFAKKFQSEFGSLSCAVLRPGGFNENDEPHLCEPLTVSAIEFAAGLFYETLKK